MSAVVHALDTEIAQIEADIAQNPDPRVKRLDHLRAVRQHYMDGSTMAAMKPVPWFERPGEGLVIRQTGRRPSPERIRILNAAHEYLQTAPDPVKTSILLAHIEGLGIKVPGEVPANNLSAMLSNDPRFSSYGGRRGWWLRALEPPTDVEEESEEEDHAA
jgi:hypothetical protein